MAEDHKIVSEGPARIFPTPDLVLYVKTQSSDVRDQRSGCLPALKKDRDRVTRSVLMFQSNREYPRLFGIRKRVGELARGTEESTPFPSVEEKAGCIDCVCISYSLVSPLPL